MDSFLNTWMWVSFIKKQINHILNKKLKKTMHSIQNDNQNIDGVNQHPKAQQSLLPLHWSTFYSIRLQNFDAVLCLMIVLDYTWKHLLFWFPLRMCFRNSVQKCIAQIYLDFFEVCQFYLNVILSIFMRSTYIIWLKVYFPISSLKEVYL